MNHRLNFGLFSSFLFCFETFILKFDKKIDPQNKDDTQTLLHLNSQNLVKFRKQDKSSNESINDLEQYIQLDNDNTNRPYLRQGNLSIIGFDLNYFEICKD